MSNVIDMEHAMIQYVRTVEEYKTQKLTFVQFGDGWIFATLLRSAANFKIKFGDLVENCSKWTHRLANLKKIVALIEEYFQEHIKKGIKTKDVDLIEIAKNFNVQETLKLFSLVIAVLTQAPNKEDHINIIMSLDQKSQTAFVSIIQNLLQTRILDKNETKEDKIFETINHLQLQNTLLRSQVESLLNQNYQMDKQIEQLKLKQIDYEEEIRKIRDQEIDKTHLVHEEPKEKEHLRNMIDNLKEKLIATVRESQIKIAGLKEEVHLLEAKSARYEEVEEQLEDYKRRYNQTIQSYGKAKLWQRQKSKLLRLVQEKDDIIKKINAKLDEANELNYAMQEKQVYAKMQLQKRDVRFKQLQKEVKKKYGSNPTIIDSSKSVGYSNMAVLSQQINEIDRLEIDQLKNEIEQLKKKNRETERESNRLKRNLEKASTLEADKKKLQRLILDLNNQNRQQIQLLLSTTYDFYSENQRLKSILNKSGVVH